MEETGIVEPKPGYLQALRDACERHGAVLIYDEVKCGGTIAYGGTTERYGVKRYPVVFVDDVMVAQPDDFGWYGAKGKYTPWKESSTSRSTPNTGTRPYVGSLK